MGDVNLDKFLRLAHEISSLQITSSLRWRMNPHHDSEHVREEKERVERVLVEKFAVLKVLFIQNRDSLFKEAVGFNEALGMLRAIDMIVTAEMESVLLGEPDAEHSETSKDQDESDRE